MALRNLDSAALLQRNNTAKKNGGISTPNVGSSPAINDENFELLPQKSTNLLRHPVAEKSHPITPFKTSCNLQNSPSMTRINAPALPSTPSPEEDSYNAEINYVLSEDLQDLADSDGALSTLTERLDSKNWLIVREAITTMRQLCIYHPDSLAPCLEKAVMLLIKAIKNPRSALCKTAVMACADLLKAYPETMITLLQEQMLLQLLLKASQDKKFVCEEAERTLQVMTECVPSSPLLMQLKPYVSHSNPRVRAKAASCVYRCVSKLGHAGLREYGFEPLLQMAGSQINDKLPEARESARKLVEELHAAYHHYDEEDSSSLDQVDWSQFCNSQLCSTVAQTVLKLTTIP